MGCWSHRKNNSSATPKTTSGIMIGDISTVLMVFLPGNSKRINAIAARMPIAVDSTAVSEPRTREFLKAAMIASF